MWAQLIDAAVTLLREIAYAHYKRAFARHPGFDREAFESFDIHLQLVLNRLDLVYATGGTGTVVIVCLGTSGVIAADQHQPHRTARRLERDFDGPLPWIALDQQRNQLSRKERPVGNRQDGQMHRQQVAWSCQNFRFGNSSGIARPARAVGAFFARRFHVGIHRSNMGMRGHASSTPRRIRACSACAARCCPSSACHARSSCERASRSAS